MSIIPTIEDSPDFTRKSQFTDTPVLNINQAFTADFTSSKFYTGGYESLLVTTPALAGSRGWVFTFKWYGEQALTNLIGQVNYRTAGAVLIHDQVANRGPWCQVTITSTSYTGSPVASLLVLPRTGTPPAAGGFGDGVVNFGSGSSINNGATLVSPAVAVSTGPATFAVLASTKTWNARVVPEDELGSVIDVCAVLDGGGTMVGATARCGLPPYRCFVAITNNDAAPQTFTWGLAVDI